MHVMPRRSIVTHPCAINKSENFCMERPFIGSTYGAL